MLKKLRSVMRLKLTIIVLMVTLARCGDIVEEDITFAPIYLLGPIDEAALDASQVTFWWSEVPGATEYNLKVVSPSFDSLLYIVRDTTLSGSTVNLDIPAGTYEWGVSAHNSVYRTAIFNASFRIRDSLEIANPDIEDELVSLLAPGSSAVVHPIVNFWWEGVDGASEYHLSVVAPSFDQIEKLVLDTMVTDEKFTVVLEEGSFEWRVKAVNELSETDYSLDAFDVMLPDTTVDISAEEIALISPQNDAEIDRGSVVFRWSELEEADAFEVLIVQPDFENSQSVAFNEIVEGELVQVELDSGSYEWGVRGINATSKTEFASRKIQVN